MVNSSEISNLNTAYSKFFEKIVKNRFVFTFETGYLKGFTIKNVLKNIEKIKDFFDAFVVPDNPFARVFPHPLALCDKIQRESGVETIMTICCRDKNRLAIQSEILGAAILDIHNLIIVTGDLPAGNDEIKSFFDIDSIQAIKIIKDMIKQEHTLNGLEVKEKLKIHIGAVVNLSGEDVEKEVERFFMKVDAGAEYAFTQMIFDSNLLAAFKDAIGKFPIPIIVSIFPIISWEQIRSLTSFSSFEIPSKIVTYFKNKKRDVSMGIKEALEIAAKAKELGFSGIHIICKNISYTKKLVKKLKGGGRLGETSYNRYRKLSCKT